MALQSGRRLLGLKFVRRIIAQENEIAMFSTTGPTNAKSCKVLVVGGGTGGISTAARFVKKVGKGNVIIIEPTDTHYYQAMWTLVGGGAKKFTDTSKPMKSVIPSGCNWIQDKAVKFDPENNTVTTEGGETVNYEYLIIGMGLQLNFENVKGLVDALKTDPNVVSNYSPNTVNKTFPALQNLKNGEAIFTFPSTPIKCAGAPQKIMYLADDYLRKNGRRDNVHINFNTALGVIFGVPKYAERLRELVSKRNITVNYTHNLTAIDADKKEAVFEILGNDKKETKSFKYDFIHVTPPMSAPDVLRNSNRLVDSTGFLDVNKETLQHVKYKNIFGIGDCTNIPTSKTAAAIAAQNGVLYKNLSLVMEGGNVSSKYDGYTSCPLVTSYERCILAEFGFDGKVMETFPVDQGKERRSMLLLKKHVMPTIYWEAMLRGYWNGPGVFRKLMHFGKS
ncbi:hypothetical protein LOTGIDRAFT_234113 [Lottia gigantea]|uniref:Sulfide:quinone oxidoreductase, mitochondrial n=1 Tax=Lottia gigantea TaxID=225164 RepID=V3ZEX9_LOTGI|nr:hypothetical protein LOTGIDRAFT_234113 [Lottia gigantea]ESO89708.1 hypothetical protein LOTGIDRAFT_234113 [Lottia gigantea]